MSNFVKPIDMLAMIIAQHGKKLAKNQITRPSDEDYFYADKIFRFLKSEGWLVSAPKPETGDEI